MLLCRILSISPERFRFVVALLASFGCFFAYICRLNLSLTIDEMVEKNEPTDCQAKNSGNQQFKEFVEASKISSPFHTEEHTLAWISKSASEQFNRSPGCKLRHDREKKMAQKKLAKQLSRNSISALSVDFETNNKVPSDSDKSREGGNATLPSGSDEVVTEPPSNLCHWSEKERNDLLGAFFLGYLMSPIPGARAAEIFGAKLLFLAAGLGGTLCSLALPYAAKCSTSIIYAYLVRILLGASQGAIFPASYVLLCEWLPRSERSFWLPIPATFGRFGTIAMNLVLPLVVINYNWEAVFYVSGALTLAWTILFFIFGANKPDESFWISKGELAHIESQMQKTPDKLDLSSSLATLANHPPSIDGSSLTIIAPSVTPPVSWLKMATNRPIMVLAMVMFLSEWNSMLLLIKLPGFLGPVLKMELVEIGLWSSVLVGVFCIQYPFSGFVASKLESANIDWLSSLRIRKLFEVVALILQSSSCLMIAFSSDKTVVLSALFLLMLGRGTVGGGQCLMPPELSRDYPGTVFAFANTLANLAGVFGPMTVNWLVVDPKEHGSWFNLWLFSAFLFLLGGLLFCLFAENGVQDYGRRPKSGAGPAGIAEDIFKMDAFSRVSSEPNTTRISNGTKPSSSRAVGVATIQTM